MIINAIKSQNLLKYAALNLQQIPEQGLIAITGANESGKSSIGETVCFALFGRTFSLGFEELTKIIRWDETHCSVELEFTPSDGKRYRLERFLDDAGNHSARLAAVDAGADDEPLARGVEQVADKVYELVGYEYEEFVESFYLAQREITTPHPHSYAVKTMAGLVTLEYCAEACREDQQETQSDIESRKADLVKLQTEVEELDIDPRLLAELQTEHGELSRRIADSEQLVERLDKASIDYQDALPKRDKTLGSRGRGAVWGTLALLLALLSGGAWYLLDRLPDHGLTQKLTALLDQRVPFWQSDMVPWLLYLAVVLSFLFLYQMFRRNTLALRLNSMQTLAKTLSDLLNELPAVDTAPAANPGPTEHEAEAKGGEQAAGPEKAAPAEAVDRAARERLSQRILDWQASLQEVRDGIGGEQTGLRQELEAASERRGELDRALAQEQARIDKADQLRGMQEELQQKIGERERHIETCALADELIQGATREVSYRFNRKLRGLVSKTLPLFTENRYEHLQIEEDLTVRAFSSEKRDFMDLDEISSGTQRQIMLAVRLALSQELVERTVRGAQFLFLDEPFAFFDEHRTRSALTVLPTLSEELKQIWIIAQSFAEDLHFDNHIRCERGVDRISLE